MEIKWILIMAVVSAAAAGQADITLTTSGDWSVASNWDSNTVPGSADTAIVGNSLTATVASAVADVYRLYMGSSGGGTLNMTAGALAVENNFIIGLGSAATFNLSGGTFTASGNTIVGQNGSGTMNISGTAIVSASTRQLLLSNSNGGGTVNMIGGQMDYKTILLGRAEPAAFNISGGTLDMAAGGSLTVGADGYATTFKVSGTNASINVNDLTLGADATYAAEMDEGGVSTMFGNSGENFTIAGNLVVSLKEGNHSVPGSVVLFQTTGGGTISGTFDSVDLGEISGDVVYDTDQVRIDNMRIASTTTTLYLISSQ